MQFTLPTTKAEMYSVLQSIYSYYRITREGFTQATLSPLEIADETYTEPDETSLAEKAETLVKAAQARETLALKKSINKRLAALNAEKAAYENDLLTLLAEINAAYDASEEKVEREAVKKGFAHSNIVIDKLAELEEKRNAAIAKATADKNALVARAEAESAALNASLSGADSYYADVHAYEKAAKIEELKEAQEKAKKETFRYNNGVSEKKQRYENEIKKANMSYQLKFMEIKSNYFTAEQLFEMGYYNDVIDCIGAYYDLLDPSAAYQDIVNESRLVFYLDDYYQDVVYMYKMRASA
ncbi:MAG: hypothetical protein ACI4RO_03265 [Candidatus Scatosoma sp.]